MKESYMLEVYLNLFKIVLISHFAALVKNYQINPNFIKEIYLRILMEIV
jgi:hypothetical protein